MELDIWIGDRGEGTVTLDCLSAVDFVEQYVKDADERKRLIVLISGETDESR